MRYAKMYNEKEKEIILSKINLLEKQKITIEKMDKIKINMKEKEIYFLYNNKWRLLVTSLDITKEKTPSYLLQKNSAYSKVYAVFYFFYNYFKKNNKDKIDYTEEILTLEKPKIDYERMYNYLMTTNHDWRYIRQDER